jgi:cytochrome c2
LRCPSGQYLVGFSSLGELVCDTVVVTPPAVTYELSVSASSAAGAVSITVSPVDASGHGGGTTPFQRAYAEATTVTLTAPFGSGAEVFDSWSGCDSTDGRVCTVQMTAARSVTAVYSSANLDSCEGCHSVEAFDPGDGGAVAPNVMGDGTLASGDTSHATPRAFDDGSYGYNVNGHGRDADTHAASGGQGIGASCVACHDISSPAGKHLDGILDGRTPEAGNDNPFHLVPGFLASYPLAAEWSAQLKFDDYCYLACHAGKTSDMRHATDTMGLHATPNVSEFGLYNSYAAPVNTPPPEMFYDANITWLGAYNGAPNFVLCVSCHNPHGTNAGSTRSDGNNKMVIYRSEAPSVLCSKCHL